MNVCCQDSICYLFEDNYKKLQEQPPRDDCSYATTWHDNEREDQQ